MGLHISSISSLPLSEEREYYIYVLDYYNWDEPISNSLQSNAEKIASFCAANNAVMIKGLPDSHFYSEVLSWVKIDGQDPYLILPALLITTAHPKYFIDANERLPDGEIEDSLIFLKVRDLCKTPSDVIQLLEKIFVDIRMHKKIRDFAITKELRAKEHGALVDALILEPNIGGVGIDIKKLASWIASRTKRH
ncbi:hypothetical protein [Dyella sp.]|uniref:hypothetical protein n=1 Tax=Dyella sp. TaxID=1869338 RepID=UPI003F81D87A